MSESLGNCCQVPSSFPPGQSLFFFFLFLSHTHNCRKKKNPNYCQTLRPVTREEGKGKRLRRTPLLLAGPDHGFSALEGHYRSSGPIYRRRSRVEKCYELAALRERFGPDSRSCILKAATLTWRAQIVRAARFLMHCARRLSPILFIPQVSALGARAAFSRTAGHGGGSSHHMHVSSELNF